MTLQSKSSWPCAIWTTEQEDSSSLEDHHHHHHQTNSNNNNNNYLPAITSSLSSSDSSTPFNSLLIHESQENLASNKSVANNLHKQNYLFCQREILSPRSYVGSENEQLDAGVGFIGYQQKDNTWLQAPLGQLLQTRRPSENCLQQIHKIEDNIKFHQQQINLLQVPNSDASFCTSASDLKQRKIRSKSLSSNQEVFTIMGRISTQQKRGKFNQDIL